MKFVDDMKIGKKLLAGFLIVALILVVVAVIGYTSIGTMTTKSTSLYVDRAVPIDQLGAAEQDFYQARGDFYKAVLIPAEKDSALTEIDTDIADIDKQMAAYSSTYMAPDEQAEYANFQTQYANWKVQEAAVVSLISAGKNDEAIPLLVKGGKLSDARTATSDSLAKLKQINVDAAKVLADGNTATGSSAQTTMIIATIIAVLVAIGLGLYLSRSITGPVDAASRNLREMSNGHLGNRMKLDRKDEIGEMAGTMDQFSEFLQKDVVGSLNKIAQCDLNIHLVPKDAQDEITPIMIQTVKSLDDMMIEVNTLVTAATEGHLDQRGNPEKFIGCYKEILVGMNNTLDAVIGPLNVAAEYVDRISKGDIPPKITDPYKGDFNEIKNNVNQCIDAVSLLVNDANLLSDAAYEGKLATRADATRHQGDFKKIIDGFNGTLDTLIGYIDSMPNPIIIIDTEFNIRYINKSGAKLADTTNGDLISQRAHCFDFFKTSDCRTPKCACANTMRTGQEAASATDAHPGKHNLDISYSAFPVKNKAGKIVGAFEIVTDLTAIKTAERLAVKVADYQNNEAKKITGALGQFAKGDLSFQISADTPDADTKAVAQQFDTIYGSLNQSVSAVRNLVTDANMLSEGAVAGKLTTRADASKHQGDYRKIIEGVNSTLDAVIDPLNMAADYVDKISKGEIPQKITAEYKGDFNVIKNNLNQCIDGLGGLVEGNAVLQRMAVNDYTTKVEGKYRGIYAEVGTAVNTVEDRIRDVTQTVNKIAVGDISKLEDYRRMGKRSENDQLMPAFIEMMEAIERMIQDSRMLADAAVAGNLATRADASKHQGDYGKVVGGVNQTLDAVIEPVNEAMRVANEYARANFTARFDEKLAVRGDFVRFRQALDNIGIQVSRALTSVNQQVNELAAGAQEASASVEEVAAGSNQIAKSASAVSINADKSSEGIRQVLSAMEDLSTTVQGVATKAETVAQLAKKSEELSKHGTDLANKADKGMDGITETSEEVNKIILDIKAQMDKIGDIVGVIANLANQTNLLALNAAIEAARAGEAGRGFAVVATEVKSLAEESHSSAENIRLMIGDLQKQTQRAAETVEKANAEVKEGSDALSQTLEVFNKIVASIDDINKNITEVAAATEEQAASVQEVTASVNSVNGLVIDTTKEATDSAAASEESSAAIEQISKVVQRVTTIVDKVTKEVAAFRVTGGDMVPEPAEEVSARSMARNAPPHTAHVA